MNRRYALQTISGVLASAAMLAVPGESALAQMTPVTGAKLSMVQYKKFTLLGGTFAKETSQVALTRATNPKVKEFAQFEVDEQTVIAQVLTNLSNPPPAPLDPGHASKLTDLQSQSGKAFDVAYVQGQIAGHQELLSIQQGYLAAMPSDLDTMHAAMLARVTIMMHLTMLSDIQTMLA